MLWVPRCVVWNYFVTRPLVRIFACLKSHIINENVLISEVERVISLDKSSSKRATLGTLLEILRLLLSLDFISLSFFVEGR